VLVEKQATVPDTYPLSLNALVNGCNQKTAREPVLDATQDEVLTAIEGLKALSLVFEGSGSRVVKYEQNMARAMQLPGAAVALLTALMLRGPQTTAELRLNAERLHRFADISSVEAFLEELAAKEPPRTRKLARAPGAREARWAHLLCGEPPAVVYVATAEMETAGAERAFAGVDVSAGELAALKAEQTRLASELEQIKTWVRQLTRELGLPDPL
jgi:uncharacterized protein